MKNLFTKYLPVPGTIQSGDVFWSGEQQCLYNFLKNIEDNDLPVISELSSNRTDLKVKMFLCSKDFKPGDTFTDSAGRVWENSEECWVKAALQWNKADRKPYAYKILGVVSKEALSWMKEGDEFYENEVRKTYNTYRDNSFEPVVDYITRTAWGDRVKIVSVERDFNEAIKCEYLDPAEQNHHPGCKQGEFYNYHPNNLGYTPFVYYKFYNQSCKHFH